MSTTPVPAATVIILRERAEATGLETFLLLRPGKGAFAGAHVFPGGRVDDGDGDPGWSTRCEGLELLAARLRSHLPGDEVRACAVAAAREVFEESGLLLAHHRVPDADTRAHGRRAVLASETSFLEWCANHDVRLAADCLVPWAHWVTPVVEARRFDTWFFLAAAPDGQTAAVLPGEALEGAWLSVDGALDALRAGAIFLAPPTLRTLEELSPLGTIAAATAAASLRRLTTVMPHRLPDTEPATLVIPGDPAHPLAAPAGIDGPTRFVMRGGRWRSENA